MEAGPEEGVARQGIHCEVRAVCYNGAVITQVERALRAFQNGIPTPLHSVSGN